MIASHPTRRSGLSIIETMAVLALLLILGAMILPSLRNTERDTKVVAATDIIRTKIAEGRAAAIEQSTPYRLSLSPDQRSIRVEPDDLSALDAVGSDLDVPPVFAEAELPKEVTVVSILADSSLVATDSEGWTRVVTFLPDGTCREDVAILEVRQIGIYAQQIRIRGLTGGVSVTKMPVFKGNQ